MKTIIEVIAGYLIDKGKKLAGEKVKKTTKVKSKLNEPAPPGEEDTIIKLGLKTNQTLVDNALINLTSSTTSHAPNLGASYDSLLQKR